MTPRELQILRELSHGDSYESVAGNLGISINSVRTHVRALYAKLGVRSKTAAVMIGVVRGLVTVRRD